MPYHFEVGEGATVYMHSDRRAGTIIARAGRTVTWQEDTATRIDKNGMSEDQTYSYERNPNGSVMVFTLRQNGRWIVKGQPMRGGTALGSGRNKFHDFSF